MLLCADYCDLIVQTAAQRQKVFRGGLATNFSCSGAALHRRIRTILAARRGRRIAALVLVIALLTVLTGKLFGDKWGEYHIVRERRCRTGVPSMKRLQVQESHMTWLLSQNRRFMERLRMNSFRLLFTALQLNRYRFSDYLRWGTHQIILQVEADASGASASFFS